MGSASSNQTKPAPGGSSAIALPLEPSDLSPAIFYLGYYFFYKKGLLLQPHLFCPGHAGKEDAGMALRLGSAGRAGKLIFSK
ncbi:hypothetical protein ACE4RR_00700 [Alteribacillus sp. HJP-4]